MAQTCSLPYDLSLPYVRRVKPCLEVRYWREGVRLTSEDGEQLVRAVRGSQWVAPYSY